MSWTDIARNGRILIVDDALENIQVLNQAVEAEHEVLFAMNGARAIDIAHNQQPDVILLDAMMPDMDGYAVCQALRASSVTSTIPIIFVTSLHAPEDETRALDAGAADFITKPVNAAVVRARVRTQLTVKRQSDVLRELTLTDGLTGVSNRRGFDEALEREWRRSARAGTPVALLLVDMDFFKRYNDEYGHQAGDTCLQEMAAAMRRSAARPQDVVARYGGEEFAVLLADGPPGAETVARKLIEQVDLLAIPHARSDAKPFVTVSIGIAALVPEGPDGAEELIRRADAQLYRAKAQGRNRYCMDDSFE